MGEWAPAERVEIALRAYGEGLSAREAGARAGLGKSTVLRHLRHRGLEPRSNPRIEARGRPFEERFWARVEKGEGCWMWQGAWSQQTGYGNVRGPDGSCYPAHRMALILAGDDPGDLHVDHLCRNKLCVRPSHLEPVTPRVNNVIRGTGVAARNHCKTHCLRGHPLEGENLYICPRGFRECRTCRRAAQARCAA